MDSQNQHTLLETLASLNVDAKIMEQLQVLQTLIRDVTAKHDSNKQQIAENNENMKKLRSITGSFEHAL